MEYSSVKVVKYLIENKAILEDTIQGDTIISYLIKKDASLEMLEYMYSINSSDSTVNGKVLIELALNNTNSFDTFKFIFENFGVEREEGKRYLIHDIVDSKKFDLNLKVKLLKLLIEEYDFDINHSQNELPASSRVFNQRDMKLLKELIKLGACINSIAKQLSSFLEQKEIKKLSPYVLKNKLNKPEYILGLLDFDSFKEYIELLEDVKDKELLINISKSMMLHDKEKVKLAQLALQKGANINELNNDGHRVNALYTYTAYFSVQSNTTFIDFLLENGAQIECNEHSAFFNVVNDNDIKCTKYLISKGANINFVNYFDNTVMNFIIHPKANFKNAQERVQMFDLLLENGLDINLPISHYQDSSSNTTPILEAVADVAPSELLEHIIDKFSSLEVNSLTMEYVIKRKDIPLEVKKRVIAKNPYVVFENEEYCKVRSESFASNILGMALFEKDEELVNYILDTYIDIKAYSEANSYIMKAVYYQFDIQTIKKLIKADPDLNRVYYIFPDEPETQTVVSSLIRGYDNFEIDEDFKVEILQF